ncbi:nitrate- and nitrite sensing domain-containing protein [Streptomyces phyllanthi]|uniref:histidine kinase n=1 Tax=Streptomyces phyllanthi TaxID=1803180 RepID=A0A5N8W6H6_9ACTN|nr:nitrate- and nitrite sensing domain-containing protein [Streptomyces phyllanthi]MPY41914.1 sensor histidine kinase [Streptomyces phyllanthi]
MPLAKDALRRFRSIRTSLLLLALVPSVALALVWLAAAGGQLSQALDLRDQTSLGKDVAAPGNDLRQAFQLERRLTAAWLADPESSRTALRAQRARTDVALAAVAKGSADLESAPEGVKTALAPIYNGLRQLPLRDLRERIDQREISLNEATGSYTRVIVAQMTALGNVSAQVADGPLVAESIPLGLLVNAAEQIQLEDTALSAALADGRLTPAARAQYTTAVGTQRWLLASLRAQASPADRAALGRVTGSVAWQRMTEVENALLTGEPGDSLPDSSRQWRAALDRVGDDLAELAQDETRELIQLQTSTADDQVSRGLLLTATGLLAVLASVLLAWRVTRSLLRRLRRLREATVTLADRQLPDVVDRLNEGERVDVGAETMELDFGDDELGEVVRAFNCAQRTAVSSAVELADARRGFEKAILGVARHTQNLVNRQVDLLDKLEREHQEPDVLDGLYQLDSQANQMRRYEENLIVISGGRPGRQWREPVLLTDVLRSAAGEVAEYQRVTVECDEHTRLAAHAVADVIHLFAELMENATQFSPRDCPVVTRVEPVGLGLAVQIEDRGLGMFEEDLAQFNDMLAKPPRFEVLALGDDTRLGLFVVSRLAARHGIKVSLRPSAFGGMIAIAVIPGKLLARDIQQPGFLNEHVLGADGAEGMAHEPGHPPHAHTTHAGPAAHTRPAAHAHAAHGWTGPDFPPPVEVPPPPAEPPLVPSPFPAADWSSGSSPVADWSSGSSSAADWSSGSSPVAGWSSSASTASSRWPSTPSTATGWPTTPPQPDADPPAPLPQRVPEASLVDELRTENAPQPAPMGLPSAQQAASAMSAFVHGTRRARNLCRGGSSYSEPSSAYAWPTQQTPTKDTR